MLETIAVMEKEQMNVDIEYVSDDSNKEYRFYERCNGTGHNHRCIDGTITGCGKCVGYCKYAGHPGFLTKRHRCQHQCLKKGCYYYVPKPKQEKKISNAKPDIKTAIFEEALLLTSEMEGLRVLSVDFVGDQEYSVRYVSISNCYPIQHIEHKLSTSSGANIVMKQIRCDFEQAAQLVCT